MTTEAFQTVLLVEPVHHYRLFLEKTLDQTEFQIVSADTPEMALAILSGMRPNLLLMEDNLPGSEGVKFLLKTREMGLDCPVVVLTTAVHPELIRLYKTLNVSDLLIKPIDGERLVRSLRAALNPEEQMEDLMGDVKSGGGGPKVLIVDDVGAIRKMLAAHLEQNNYTPLEAADGQEAINMVSAGSVEVILLDYNMRGMNGLDVLRELKSRKITIPTLLISAQVSDENVSQARSLGVIDFYPKPIDLSALMTRINEIVGKRATTAGDKKRILIADDDRQICDLMKKVLDNKSRIILTAHDGYEAQIEIRLSRFDLVVLDLNLPGLDGMQVLKEIHEEDPNTPVVIISAFLGEEVSAELGEGNVVKTYHKPIDLNEFVAVVAEILE